MWLYANAPADEYLDMLEWAREFAGDAFVDRVTQEPVH